MASPRVFVSSTIYDLGAIREQICQFITEYGFIPVLSENGDVFFNPNEHTHLNCIQEINTCQMFVLIISGRYGGIFSDSGISITHAEYREAFQKQLKIFTLINQSVSRDHLYYTQNQEKILQSLHYYPLPKGVDNIKVFEFIDEVRRKLRNNAYSEYNSFSEIKNYLIKQWSGMFFHYLHQDILLQQEKPYLADFEKKQNTQTNLIERISPTQLIEFRQKGLL